MEVAAATPEQVQDELASEFDLRFESVRRRLHAVCVAIAGSDDAADLVQETYLRAADRLHQLRDPDLFDAWIVRIALNEARSAVRRRRRRLEQAAGFAIQVAPVPDAELRQLVDQLAPRERAVIVLHYGYGYRMAEI